MFSRSIVLLCLFVAGCAGSISKDLAYDENGKTAFVVLATNHINPGSSTAYSFNFRKVDLENGKFLKGSFKIEFPSPGSFAALSSDQLATPEDVYIRNVFGGKDVTPGVYALTSTHSIVSYGASTRTSIFCSSLGAPVFALEPGVVNVVATGSGRIPRSPDANQALAEAQIVLSAYPNIAAEIVSSPRLATIEFDGGKSMFGQPTCQQRGGFSIKGASEQSGS